jgi:hypothetical protein
MEFGLVIGFIEHLQNVTTNNYDSLTELHTAKGIVITAHTGYSQFSLAVAWLQFSTTDVPLHLGSRCIPCLSYHLHTSQNCISHLTQQQLKSKLSYDRRSVGQSISVSGAQDQIFVTVRELRVCWCGALSLTRGRVCPLQLLLALARAVIFGSESHGIHDHILLSQILDSPNLEGQATVFISPRNRVTQLYPQALGSLFVASYEYSNPPPRGVSTTTDWLPDC